MLSSVASAADSTPLTYNILDICAPQSCRADVLNNNGTVAGSQLDGQPATFLVRFGQPVVNITQLTGLVLGVSHINDSDVIVGSFRPDGQSTNYHAYAYVPATSQLFDLNPVFGWTSGGADFINNKGDITGAPGPRFYIFFDAPPIDSPVIVNGVSFDRLWAIGDNGVALGYVNPFRPASPVKFVIAATPDGVVTTSTTSNIHFEKVFVNNRAQALVLTPGAAHSTWLFTPGIGEKYIGEGWSPDALSDSGLVVATGSCCPNRQTTSQTVLFDASGGGGFVTVGPLLTLISPSYRDWTINAVQAINAKGQILALAIAPNGRYTSVLLSPSSASLQPSSATVPVHSSSAMTAPASDVDAPEDCPLRSLNGTSLNCGIDPAVHRRHFAPASLGKSSAPNSR